MHPLVVALTLVLALTLHGAKGQDQAPPQTTPATIVLPANVVVLPQQQGQGAPAPAPATTPQLVPQPSAPPPTPPKEDTAQEEALRQACPALDTLMAQKYDAFFLLNRLVNMYTLDNTEPTSALNATYEPITILVPQDSTVDFLRAQNIDITSLAKSSLQSVLLAPTLTQHFVRGYWPANALPVQPVETLCGPSCAAVQFRAGDEHVRVFSGNANVTIVDQDVVNCPGRYVVHTVSDYLYTPVADPLSAAQPALNLAYALGGLFDTYQIAQTPPASSG